MPRTRLRTGGLHDTEDLTQGVYRTLWREVSAGRHHNTLTDRAALSALLRMLAHQTATRLRRFDSQQCRDPARATLLTADPPAAGSGPEDHLVWADALAALDGRLTARQQRLVRLRLDGLSDAEIAARLGCSCRTVYRELVEVRAVAGDLLGVAAPAACRDV